jgi:hypothetical protein
MEYIRAVYERYRKATKEAKSQILEELCKVCGYNRKYAIRKLGGPAPDPQEAPRRRHRGFFYSQECIQVAEMIWRASGHLCGQRLKQAIPLWLPALKKRLPIRASLEQELHTISARQLDERLRNKKNALKRRIYCTTRPGSLLKSMIPIRTSNWDLTRPGFLEIDLVAHCGNSNEGQFIYTLDTTDIHTGWTERRAVLGKGQTGILESLKQIKEALPFRLKGIDSDNGEEFINYQLLRYCQGLRPGIEFTRGRGYRKNDNAYIEQKNWTHVRQIFGWDRYESEEALRLMNQLYSQELRLLQNFFQPSLKLKAKKRVGSKLIRRYDIPQTPFQRILSSGQYHRVKMKQLKILQASLDPFALSESIDKRLAHLLRLTSQRVSRHRPSSASPQNQGSSLQVRAIPIKKQSSWGNFSFSPKTKRLQNRLRQIEATATQQRQNHIKGGLVSVTS